MKIIRIDRIGEYERRLEVEFDGDDASQFRRAAGLVFEAGDITHISIHVPREGHDFAPCELYPCCPQFLSTCPVRGTTMRLTLNFPTITFLSTCPVRGTTPPVQAADLRR